MLYPPTYHHSFMTNQIALNILLCIFVKLLPCPHFTIVRKEEVRYSLYLNVGGAATKSMTTMQSRISKSAKGKYLFRFSKCSGHSARGIVYWQTHCSLQTHQETTYRGVGGVIMYQYESNRAIIGNSYKQNVPMLKHAILYPIYIPILYFVPIHTSHTSTAICTSFSPYYCRPDLLL